VDLKTAKMGYAPFSLNKLVNLAALMAIVTLTTVKMEHALRALKTHNVILPLIPMHCLAM
jgi:hypothetical protein